MLICICNFFFYVGRWVYLGWPRTCCLHFITMYFYMKFFTISISILKAFSIFVCILVTGFKHMFFSISCSSSLENDFCEIDRKLWQKNE